MISDDGSESQEQWRWKDKIRSDRRHDHAERRRLSHYSDRGRRKLSLQVHTFSTPQQRAISRHAIKFIQSPRAPTPQKCKTTRTVRPRPTRPGSGAAIPRLPVPPITTLVGAATFKPTRLVHLADRRMVNLATKEGEAVPLMPMRPNLRNRSPSIAASMPPSPSSSPQRPPPQPLTHQGQHHAFTDPALFSRAYIDELKSLFAAPPGRTISKPRSGEDVMLFLPSNAVRLRSSTVGAATTVKERDGQMRERLFFPPAPSRGKGRGERPRWRA